MHPLVATYLTVALLTTFYTLRRVPDEHGPLAPDWMDRCVLTLTAFVAGAVWPLFVPFVLAAWWRSRAVRAYRARVASFFRPRTRARPFGRGASPVIDTTNSRTETSGQLAS